MHGAILLLAIWVYTPVLIQGHTVLQTFGINDRGQCAISTFTDGGIYQHGRFTILPPRPDGLPTVATGINNQGLVVGIAFSADFFVEQAFILRGTAYTLFSRPDADGTEARGVSDSGLVSAVSVKDDAPTGFLYDPVTGTLTDVVAPGSPFSIVQGINSTNQVAGNGFGGPTGRFGFVWEAGAATTFQVADGRTNARGINDSGVVTGFANSGGVTVGFIGKPGSGFDLIRLPGAGANATICSGINNAPQILCSFSEPDTGVGHAFIVSRPDVALSDLLAQATNVGPGGSLEDKVREAQADYASGDAASGCSVLDALVNEVNAQTFKKLAPAAAASIRRSAISIEAAICQ
jgi:uncharacterized membrane protein